MVQARDWRHPRACPCGCGGFILSRLYACRAGWARLPTAYRVAINRAYRSGTREAHEAAKAAADRWFKNNPTSQEGTPQ